MDSLEKKLRNLDDKKYLVGLVRRIRPKTAYHCLLVWNTVFVTLTILSELYFQYYNITSINQLNSLNKGENNLSDIISGLNDLSSVMSDYLLIEQDIHPYYLS